MMAKITYAHYYNIRFQMMTTVTKIEIKSLSQQPLAQQLL